MSGLHRNRAAPVYPQNKMPALSGKGILDKRLIG